MKIKILSVSIVALIIVFVICSSIGSVSGNKISFSFPKKFESLMLKNRLRIVLIRDLDYFQLPLDECLQDFYHGMLGIKSYELEDRKKNNKISVSEYIFKDSIAAVNAFHLVYSYAESVRKKRLKDWGTLCYTIPIGQVYYASQDGLHIYLYTTSYKFSYRSREESVDMLMQSDKRILLDNLYKEIIEIK